jgi:hypothetical protein
MKMDKAKVRKALDHFENDEYVDAKEILSKEIKGSVDAHVKDKCDLKNDIDPTPDKEGDGDKE